MTLTYYDMEKLMQAVYDQKLSTSLRRMGVRRSRVLARVRPCERVPCRIRPSGAAAK